MSEYKAIRALNSDLVNGITPEIMGLMDEAWSRSLIGPEQHEAGIASNVSDKHKAREFVLAIANRVNVDSEAFGMFLELLDLFPSLQYLAKNLRERAQTESEKDLLHENDVVVATTSHHRKDASGVSRIILSRPTV